MFSIILSLGNFPFIAVLIGTTWAVYGLLRKQIKVSAATGLLYESGFITLFALPYLILSIKPTLLSFLPKPGAWMETFKQFMAFPMWASALWLLWVLSGQVDSDTVLLVLIGGLIISLSLWLIEKKYF